MSDFNLYDFKALAERGIVISFDKTGMTATRDNGDVCEEYHHIEYELLLNLAMAFSDLMDIWFPKKKEDKQ